MEQSEQRLLNLMDEISLIYIEGQESQTLQKKMENYNRGMKLISEAKEILNSIQKDIANLDSTKFDSSHVNNINHFLDLLSNPSPKLTELIYIIKYLKNVEASLPTSIQVNDHVEKVLFEKKMN
ncbi:MAG: hypothetical protein QXW79_00765 [Thermoplasmata archaeon]